ncbi:MAG: hypothetical protein RPS47_04645 [Colwellia sp.]
MFQFTHNGHDIVIGLIWESSSKKSELSSDFSERHNSDRSVLVKGDSRVSWGVVKNSKVNDDLPKDCVSLAAIQAQQFKSSAWLIALPQKEKNSIPQYWGCLISDGVPEIEVVNEDIDKVVHLLNTLLDDEVEDVINVDSPILYTDLPLVTMSSSSNWEEFLGQRKWRQSEYEIDDLSDLLLNRNFRAVSQIGGISRGLDFSRFGSRENITRISFLVFAMVSITYVFGGFSDSEISPILEYTSPVQRSQPVIDISNETKRVVSEKLAPELLGIRRGWALNKRNTYLRLPGYSYGYRKSHMACAIIQMRCEYTFKADENYSDLNRALDKLSPYFENITFSTDGKNITGLIKIDYESLYTKVQLVEDLPVFDSGREITSKSIMLTKSRPGLTMNTTNAELMQVDFKKRKITPDPNVEIRYMIIGWAASGSYKHQIDVVTSALKSKYISINSISIQSENGQTSFNLRGSYLMRINDGE